MPRGGSQRSHNSVHCAISRIYGAATPAYFRISRKTGGYCHRYITHVIHMAFSTTSLARSTTAKSTDLFRVEFRGTWLTTREYFTFSGLKHLMRKKISKYIFQGNVSSLIILRKFIKNYVSSKNLIEIEGKYFSISQFTEIQRLGCSLYFVQII